MIQIFMNGMKTLKRIANRVSISCHMPVSVHSLESREFSHNFTYNVAFLKPAVVSSCQLCLVRDLSVHDRTSIPLHTYLCFLIRPTFLKFRFKNSFSNSE